MKDFDDYAHAEDYRSEVERSFSFTGLDHDLFVTAKVDALLDIARRRLGDLAGKSALDVGCGVGSMQPALAAAFGTSYGVDVSAKALDEARARSPSSVLSVYDGEKLPFDDGAADVVFAVNVLHHVPPPRWPAFARELVRVTKTGGLALVFEHNPWNPLTRLAVFRCAFDHDAVLLRRSTTRRLLLQSGANLVEQRYLLFVPVNAGWARRTDGVFARVPIGAQYVVAVTPRGG